MSLRRLLVCLTLVALCAAPASAQRIASLQILTRTDELGRGPELDHGILGRMLEARAGGRYSPAVAARDLARLVATGLFSAEGSDYWVEPAERGVVLTYALQPNPVVATYEYGRASGVGREELDQVAMRIYPVGRIFDATRRVYAADAIREVFETADISVDVGLPAVDRTGCVRFPIVEHRVRSLLVQWVGPPLLRDGVLWDVLSLHPRGALRPSMLEQGRQRLSASGLLESVSLAISTPDALGFVDVRVNLDARSLPAPSSRSAMALMDPALVPQCVAAVQPLEVSVPFDLTPPVELKEVQERAATGDLEAVVEAALACLEEGDYRLAEALCERALAADDATGWVRVRLATIVGQAPGPLPEPGPDLAPLERARLAFAVAEAEVRRLAETLGLAPQHPASMRDLAALLVDARPGLAVDSRPYAAAMARATEAVLGLEDPASMRAALPLIEELLVSREYLRSIDRQLSSAPAPLPPFTSIAVGNRRILAALLAWRREEGASPRPCYALGMHALGRAFAAAQDPAVTQSAGAAALGGVREAARLAAVELARVEVLDPKGYWPGLTDYRALAELLADPGNAAEGVFPELLCDESIAHPEALLYAAAGPEGLLASGPTEVRIEVGRALAARLEPRRPRGPELAALAQVWTDDLEGARTTLDRAQAASDGASPTVARIRGLIGLRSGDLGEAMRMLTAGSTPQAPDLLLGATLYAAGDIDAAARAYGLEQSLPRSSSSPR